MDMFDTFSSGKDDTMFVDMTSEKEKTCCCVDQESSEQATLPTGPVELDDADLDAVVGGVLCCSGVSCSSSGRSSSLCCSN